MFNQIIFEFKTSLRTGTQGEKYHRLIGILISITHIIVPIFYTCCCNIRGILDRPQNNLSGFIIRALLTV